MSVRVETCRCCGQALPGDEAALGIVAWGTQQEIVRLLLRRKDGMSREQIEELLWAHRPGGGPNSHKNLDVHLHRIRRALKADGRYALVRHGRAPGRYLIARAESA